MVLAPEEQQALGCPGGELSLKVNRQEEVVDAAKGRCYPGIGATVKELLHWKSLVAPGSKLWLFATALPGALSEC
jgi:hypothetical protein